MQFEWNQHKNMLNCKKHGLNFEDAYLIFEGRIVTFIDDRDNYGEERFISLGQLFNRTVVIVHTKRGDKIRIISMRKANERETKIYTKRSTEIR